MEEKLLFNIISVKFITIFYAEFQSSMCSLLYRLGPSLYLNARSAWQFDGRHTVVLAHTCLHAFYYSDFSFQAPYYKQPFPGNSPVLSFSSVVEAGLIKRIIWLMQLEHSSPHPLQGPRDSSTKRSLQLKPSSKLEAKNNFHKYPPDICSSGGS